MENGVSLTHYITSKFKPNTKHICLTQRLFLVVFLKLLFIKRSVGCLFKINL